MMGAVSMTQPADGLTEQLVRRVYTAALADAVALGLIPSGLQDEAFPRTESRLKACVESEINRLQQPAQVEIAAIFRSSDFGLVLPGNVEAYFATMQRSGHLGAALASLNEAGFKAKSQACVRIAEYFQDAEALPVFEYVNRYKSTIHLECSLSIQDLISWLKVHSPEHIPLCQQIYQTI